MLYYYYMSKASKIIIVTVLVIIALALTAAAALVFYQGQNYLGSKNFTKPMNVLLMFDFFNEVRRKVI